MRPVSLFIDFDGTISRTDSLKWVLDRFGGRRWINIEKKLVSGAMSEAAALEEAFARFPYTPDFIWEQVKDQIQIDPHFVEFYGWARAEGCEIEILSGGFSAWIQESLASVGIHDLKIKANAFTATSTGWKILPSQQPRLCELCHHCKTSSVLGARLSARDPFVVYIGDGHTDRCPVSLADLVFAKKSLEVYCSKNALSFQKYDNFRDVQLVLKQRLLQKDFASSFRASPFAS